MLLIRSDFVCCEVLIALSLGGVFYKAWLSVALTNGLFTRAGQRIRVWRRRSLVVGLWRRRRRAAVGVLRSRCVLN